MKCSAELPIIISYPTSTSGVIVLIKNNQEILLDLADLTLQEQPEDNYFNGCYFSGMI